MNKIKRLALTTVLVLGITIGGATTAQADTRPVPTVPSHSSTSTRGHATNCFTIIFRGVPHKVCVLRSSMHTGRLSTRKPIVYKFAPTPLPPIIRHR